MKIQVNPGDTFNQWVIIKETTKPKAKYRTFQCKCTCGTVRNVLLQNLRNGSSKCCGYCGNSKGVAALVTANIKRKQAGNWKREK